MLQLNDREWKDFSVYDIFETEYRNKKIQVPTGSNVARNELTYGTIPRITVTSQNNGVYGFYKENCNVRSFSNFISVSFLGNAFYHPYTASLDMKVHCLKPKNIELTNFLAEFLICSLMLNISRHSYGDQLSSTDLPKKRLMLPIGVDKLPDYDFMEQYIKEREEKLIQKYQKYIGKINQFRGVLTALNKKQWMPFFISDIFNIESGKRLTSKEMQLGKIPFVGSTDSNNGITNWISNKNSSLDRNVLGVNYNGSVVENFYHEYDCAFSDDVKRLHLKNVTDNKFILLFFKSVILQQKSKYTYGYKFNATRMSRQLIMLPVNNDKYPDFDYMEQYGKSIMYKKYIQYLNYIKA